MCRTDGRWTQIKKNVKRNKKNQGHGEQRKIYRETS